MSTVKRPAVDTRMYDLAEFWLSEDEGATVDDIWTLAQLFQTAAEDMSRLIAERAPSHD